MARKKIKGFTLVEALVGTAVFLFISFAVYNSYTSLYNIVGASHLKITGIDLANEQLEIARNLPYGDVGIAGSIPSGKLTHVQTFVRDGTTFNATTTVRNIDDPFDGTLGGSPNDTAPADYKLVEIEVGCSSCKNFPNIIVTTLVMPKNLENSSTNGALFVKVLDANGQVVPDAAVHIVNSQVVPTLTIDDTTNAAGMLQIVDVPPGINAYQITVTKSGFTTDKTYTPGAVGNPNPTKPHATVALQQVTQLSFVIDKVSTLTFSTVKLDCTPVGGINFSLKGTKLIGTPSVYKFNQSYTTDAGGNKNLGGMEWDTYNLTLTDSTYDLVGSNPLAPINLPPDNVLNMQLIVAPKSPSTLLVTVKDASTGLPISAADVTLTKSGYDTTLQTGRGYSSQTDWSGGGGIATSTNPTTFTKYLSDDGNVVTSNPVGDVKLLKIFSDYVSNGILTSSAFDTGSASNFQQILWEPQSQPIDTGVDSVKMQIATNANGGVWNFLGPDGTSGSYYTVSNNNINAVNNGNRYLRYKMYLHTASTTYTPSVGQVAFTYTTACVPPGQAAFTALSNGTYTLEVSKTGYITSNTSVSVSSNWQQTEIVLLPE